MRAARDLFVKRMPDVAADGELQGDAAFSEELRERLNLRDGRMLAVCYLDIDRFRDVNDRFGPIGGDTVLREVARRLKAGRGRRAAEVHRDVAGYELALGKCL